MMSNSKCVTESYLSVTLVMNNNIYWSIEGNFSPDYVLGITCIGTALTNHSYEIEQSSIQSVISLDHTGYFIARSANKELILSQLQDLDKLGGYISDRNRTTAEALQCIVEDESSPQDCEFREIKPDDGTKAAWVFDHNEKEARWNLIMTDCVRDFLAGFNLICEVFGIDMWDYILGEPLESEGGVGSWASLISSCYSEDI